MLLRKLIKLDYVFLDPPEAGFLVERRAALHHKLPSDEHLVLELLALVDTVIAEVGQMGLKPLVVVILLDLNKVL